MLQAFFTRASLFVLLSPAVAPLAAQGQALTGPSSYVSIEAPAVAGFGRHNYRVYWGTFGLSNPNGMDLLQLIFGNDEVLLSAGSPPRYRIGDGPDHFEVQRYGFGDLVDNFTIGGSSVSQDADFDPSWSYFESTDGATWSPSLTGAALRAAADGSYDGWTLSAIDPFFNPVDYPASTPGDWASAVNIAAVVPEPRRALLTAAGMFLILTSRRRCRA